MKHPEQVSWKKGFGSKFSGFVKRLYVRVITEVEDFEEDFVGCEGREGDVFEREGRFVAGENGIARGAVGKDPLTGFLARHADVWW